MNWFDVHSIDMSQITDIVMNYVVHIYMFIFTHLATYSIWAAILFYVYDYH